MTNTDSLASVPQETDKTHTEELLARFGISTERWNGLSSQSREVVATGLTKLETINQGGLTIENSDRQTLGQLEGFKDIVQMNSEEIIRGYHGQNDWMARSANLMFSSAEETDQAKQDNLKAGVEDTARYYLGRLGNAGKDYRELMPSHPTISETTVGPYLRGRDEQVASLNYKVGFQLHETIAKIPLKGASV